MIDMSGSAPTSPSTQPKQKAVTGTFSTFDQDEQHRKLIREGKEARAALSSSLPLSLYVLHFGNKLLQGSKQHRNPLADLALTRMTPRIVKQPWWKRLITTNRKPSGQVVKPVSELEAYLLAVPYAFPLHMSSQVMEEDIVQLSATDYSLRTAVENLDYQEMKLIHSIKNRLARTGRDCTIMALTSGRPSDLIPLGPSGSINCPSTTLLFLLKHVSRREVEFSRVPAELEEPIAQPDSHEMAHDYAYIDDPVTVPGRTWYGSQSRLLLFGRDCAFLDQALDSSHPHLRLRERSEQVAQSANLRYFPSTTPDRVSSTSSSVYLDPVDELLARWTTALDPPGVVGSDADGFGRSSCKSD